MKIFLNRSDTQIIINPEVKEIIKLYVVDCKGGLEILHPAEIETIDIYDDYIMGVIKIPTTKIFINYLIDLENNIIKFWDKRKH